MSKKLTDKQKRFCEEYMMDLNATQAAIRAGYSKKTAAEIGCENLIKPNIQAYIANSMKKRSDKVGVSAEEILNHLNILRKSRIDEYVHFVNIRAVVGINEETGDEIVKEEQVLQFKPFDELTEEQLMCIESIKNTRAGIELKLHGKDWTIDKIGKHISFYAPEKHETKHTVNYIDLGAGNKPKEGS